MLRFVPPAGAPLAIREILQALKVSVFGKGIPQAVLSGFAAQMKVRYAFATSSGRAGLWVILRALRRLRSGRNIVAVPAYTCFSVPAAVVRCGLRIFPVDIDPQTLDVDHASLERLPDDGLLCIVTSNLFGLVNDVAPIREIARAKGSFLLDDAAQALGASRAGSLCGTSGEVGLFSFGRGKALAAGEGGIIITDSEEISRAVGDEIQRLPPPSISHTLSLLLQMLAYSVFLNPRLYWIPNLLPFLKLGVTEFAPDFRISTLPGISLCLLGPLMKRLGELNRIRRENAAALSHALVGHTCFSTINPAMDCQPNYPRFPVVAKDRTVRDRAVHELRAVGIGASAFYPSAICDIRGIERHMVGRDFHRARAEAVSQRLFTLPTHSLVRRSDLDQIAKVLGRF